MTRFHLRRGGSQSEAHRESPTVTAAQDPLALLRSRGYVLILAFAAALGAPVALVSYGFLELALYGQRWFFGALPKTMGFAAAPAWWPLLVVTVGGLLVGLVVRYLPGQGGESPVEGFRAGAPPEAQNLAGIALAALVTLAFGAVLGPEAPLIALGGGLAAWAVNLVRRDAPAQAIAVIGAAGSFAAISTLLGSPLLGAFLLMEVAGVGAGRTSMLLVPGLLAAGIGSLIFIGLDHVTGLAKPALEIPRLPPVGSPTVVEFGWAIVIGIAAALLGTGIRQLARILHRTVVGFRVPLATAGAGLVVGLLAVLYTVATGKVSGDVLFSGEHGMGPLLLNSGSYSAAALLLLLVCKGLAYGFSMSAFRGGPVFPAMYLGAVGGLLLSHAPGLHPIHGAAMGIGAMCVAILGFPLVSVLLATLLLLSNGLTAMPLVIVAVVVAYVGRARLLPEGPATTATTPPTHQGERPGGPGPP